MWVQPVNEESPSTEPLSSRELPTMDTEDGPGRRFSNRLNLDALYRIVTKETRARPKVISEQAVIET